jgi:hypothetical protein
MSTHESKGMSLVSRRWKVDVKETVNNYNFKLHHVHGESGKCDFCGNNLIYVAVIEGDSLIEANTMDKCTKKVYNVGMDCLQLVLGEEWVYYRQAKREIAKLKKEAAAKRRAKKYAVKYKDMFDWFESLHPEQIKKNYFYRSMLHILKTGERVFTPNMEKAIRNKMDKTKISADEYEEKLKHHKEVVIPRIGKLLDLVKEVDNIDKNTYDIPKWSAFDFVYSVLSNAIERNRLTPGQKDALNKVHVRYTKKKKEMSTVNKGKELDTSNIPY